jgi:hypothetical protein
VAESLDWSESLGFLHSQEFYLYVVNATLGIILKYQDDVDKVRSHLAEFLS